jgi:hypothetical protein
MPTSFAYVHCKPDGTPFYVGKGALRRVKYLGERNSYHQAVVKKYGKDNILIGMFECSSADIAYDLERGLIKCLRRSGIKLTNFTDGGEGGLNPTPETRKRLSNAAKKRGFSEACQAAKIAAKKGKPLSEEQKAKQSLSMKGIVFTEEHRANISISAKKRGMSRELKEKAWSANTGKKQSVETIEKRRLAMIAVWDRKGRKQKPKVKKTCWATRATRAIYIDGIYYPSLKLASAATGISSSLLCHALKNSGYAKGKSIKEVTNASH